MKRESGDDFRGSSGSSHCGIVRRTLLPRAGGPLSASEASAARIFPLSRGSRFGFGQTPAARLPRGKLRIPVAFTHSFISLFENICISFTNSSHSRFSTCSPHGFLLRHPPPLRDQRSLLWSLVWSLSGRGYWYWFHNLAVAMCCAHVTVPLKAIFSGEQWRISTKCHKTKHW